MFMCCSAYGDVTYINPALVEDVHQELEVSSLLGSYREYPEQRYQWFQSIWRNPQLFLNTIDLDINVSRLWV